jgi:hypothetical protein
VSTVALPQLQFGVESATAMKFAAAPTVAFGLRLECDMPVRSIQLNAQVRIVPGQRAYGVADEERLVELFGTPDRWGETLHGFLWTNATLIVPPFTGSTLVELPLAATYDLDVAAAKYFHALGDGEAPLELLFSGTLFYADESGQLRVARIPWECEAHYRLPVAVWREAMENHFPGAAWLRLRRDVFDRLLAYRASHTLPTWEHAVEALLDEAER